MYPWSSDLHGRYEELTFESEVLKKNLLGDPYRRPLWVYLPPGYDTESDRRYPTVYMIQGLTGQLDMWRNRSPFRKNFPELADELFAREEAPPCILVWVDCWTSLGGSQFVDSPAMRRGRTLDRYSLPDAGPARAPGNCRQVKRRLWSYDYPHAATGFMGRTCHPCW